MKHPLLRMPGFLDSSLNNIWPSEPAPVRLPFGRTDFTVHSPQSESVPSTLWAARNAGLFHFLLQTRFSPGPLFPRRLRFKISRTGPKEIHACVCARDGRSDGVHRIHAPGNAARSEERRGGNECVSTCRYRGVAYT